MKIRILSSVILTCLLLQGCLSYREMVNFQDGADLGRKGNEAVGSLPPLTIRPDDLLQVNINSYNMEEAQRFNLISNQMQAQISSSATGPGLADPIGYRVDSRGFIEMPVIGTVRAAGATLEQLRDSVKQRVLATGYLKDVSVQVRYLSFRVTILGEVNNPGTFTIPSQKVNVLEALGLARDVTMYSRRDNILVVREEDGKRSYGRIDLKSKAVFQSPYYQLKPNDILYVEPHRSKVLSAPDPVSRYLGIIIGVATLATLITTL
jgi:polysaccharide export outer membrane protein